MWLLEAGQGVTLEDGRLVGWVDSERMLEQMNRAGKALTLQKKKCIVVERV